MSTVVWDSDGYYAQTAPFGEGGEAYLSSNPCGVLSALEGSPGVLENQRGLIDQVTSDCAVYRQMDTTITQPAPVAPSPIAAEGTAVQTGPRREDSAERQAAPAVAPTATVTARPLRGSVNSTDPARSVFDQWAPIAPEVLATWLAPPGATQAQTRETRDNLAHNQPAVGEIQMDFSAPVSQRPSAAADPIDLFSGRLKLHYVDLEVPTSGVPIRFHRIYRSGKPYFGPFGYGWDHNYNVYLRPLNSGDMAYWTGRLHESIFTAEGVGWRPEVGLAARLERAGGPGDVFEIVNPGGVRFRFERPSGWSSTERIPLVLIRDRHGNRVSLAYDAMDRVESVLDASGRGLVMEYGMCGLLEHVRDHTGSRHVRYDHHDEKELLVRVIQPATAQFPKGVSTVYDYDVGAAHPAMRSNIVRVLDANRRTYLLNEYAGPDVGWAFNSVTRQVYGGHEYQFEYTQLQYVPADAAFVDLPASRTAVRSPDGSLRLHTFNYRGDLLDLRYRLNRDRSYRVVHSRFRYDSHGNTVEAVSPDGRREVTVYDDSNPDPCSRGNLLKVERVAALPALTSSRIIQRNRYDPTFQLLVERVAETGATTRYIYDFDTGDAAATGRLLRVENPDVTLPDGSSQASATAIKADMSGAVTETISPEGRRTTFEYVVGGIHHGFLARLTQDADGAALQTTFEYDAAGFPARITAPGGRSTVAGYNALGQVESLLPPPVDGVSEPVRQWYGDDGSPVRIERPRGGAADGLLDATGDAVIVDLVERDVRGTITGVSVASNSSKPRSWHSRVDYLGNPVRTIDSSGALVERRYDERGLVIREQRGRGTADATTESFRYDLAGRPERSTDVLGRVTTVDYDLWGRVHTIENPGGARQVHGWGPADRLEEITEEGNAGEGEPDRVLTRWTYGYDERNRLTSVTSWAFTTDVATATPLKTTYTYDRDDYLRKVELPRGSTLHFDYDGVGRLAWARDALGGVREYHYGPNGDLLQMTEAGPGPSILVTDYSYDARGRVINIAAPTARVRFDRDERGAVVARHESGGVSTHLTRNVFGDVVESVLDPGVAPGSLSIQSRWEYSDTGQVVGYTDPTGAHSTWQYDHLGRRKATTLADGSSWSSSADVASRTTTQSTPGGSRIIQTAGESGQVIRLEVAAGPGMEAIAPHTNTYDSLGRLVSATKDGGTIRRRWDSLHRLVEEITAAGTVRMLFDDVSGATTLIYPNGRQERTEVDPAGRPLKVTVVDPGPPEMSGDSAGDVLAAINYNGLPAAITQGNSVETSISRDPFGRLVGVVYTRAGVIRDSWRARYDERGRRALIQSGEPVPRSILHRFDARDRLIEARWNFLSAPLSDISSGSADQAAAIAAATVAAAAALESDTYELASSDARLRRTRVRTGVTPVTDDSTLGADHRPISIASTGGTGGIELLGYHSEGNRTSDAAFGYDIDALGRVIRVKDAASGTVIQRFRYDALSRTVGVSTGATSCNRAFAGDTWIQENNVGGGGIVGRQRTPHPIWDVPLCVRDATGTFWPQYDGGLSTSSVTDSAGVIVERHSWDPFGLITLSAADGLTPLSGSVVDPVWRGMPLATEIGRLLTPARMYDPHTGVFLARDPELYLDGPAPYVVAGANPVDFADPTGLAKEPSGLSQKSRPATTPSAGLTVTALAPPDWTTTVEPGWTYPTTNDTVFPAATGYDTGNRAANVVVNKVLLPWRNVLAFWENAAFATLIGVDRALNSSPIGVEYRAAQDIVPLFRTWGLAVEVTPAAVNALKVYARASVDVAKWASAAPVPVILSAGGGGGGILPLRSAAARAAFGWGNGLIDVGEGSLGFSSYSTAPSVIKALGMSGMEMENMHMLPQAVGNALPSAYGYNANRALTTPAPRLLHSAWDRTWTPVWNAAVKNGTRMTGDDVYQMLVRALENPSPDATGAVYRFSAEVRGTITFAIESEFKALGIEGSTVILPGK